MRITRIPAAATRTKSTSFARTAGLPRSTFMAVSSPRRIDAIIPEAPQSRATRDTSPIAERGVAICSIDVSMFPCPDSDTGRRSTISSVTRCRSSSSWSTSPKIETSAIVSGNSEKRTRYAIAAAYCVQRSANMSSTARGRARKMPRTTPPR
jgi:hypothetical protein